MNYRANEDNPYQVCAGCVVINNGKILLLKRESEPGGSNGGYHLPKGTLEDNETLEQCAVRETKEESGVTPILTNYLGALTKNFKHPEHAIVIDKTTHYFLAESSKDEPLAHDGEHDQVLWLPVAEAIDKLRLMPKSEDKIVQRALEIVKNNAE